MAKKTVKRPAKNIGARQTKSTGTRHAKNTRVRQAKSTGLRHAKAYLYVLALVVFTVVGAKLVIGSALEGASLPNPPETTLYRPLDPTKVRAASSQTKYFSWYFIDLRSGEFAGPTGGSTNAASWKNTSESMIKPGIAADYLRRLGRAPTSTELAELRSMIIYSNDYYAEKYYKAGGGNAVIQRIKDRCGLAGTGIVSGWWSKTTISALDAAKYGQCIANGRLAGTSRTGFPSGVTATEWVLKTMREVWGSVSTVDTRYSTAQKDGGRWGIIDALVNTPMSTQTSIKNGWTYHGDTGRWHINCLAVHKDWVLAIEMQTGSKSIGASECKQAAKLFIVEPTLPTTPPPAPPTSPVPPQPPSDSTSPVPPQPPSTSTSPVPPLALAGRTR